MTVTLHCVVCTVHTTLHLTELVGGLVLQHDHSLADNLRILLRLLGGVGRSSHRGGIAVEIFPPLRLKVISDTATELYWVFRGKKD